LPLHHRFLKFKKVIRLPEFGYIGLTEDEIKVIDTFEFQRLRGIKQSPGGYMVYPGMSHTRFEHSLGVMHLAGEAATNILLNHGRDNRNEGQDIVQRVRLAGLLHDIGHGPLSHTYELAHEYSGITWDHEKAGHEIIKQKLKDALERYSPQDIIKLLDTNQAINNDERFMRDIIIHPVYNVDRLDYLILDSYRAGVIEYGFIDVSRILQNLYLDDENNIVIDVKAKDACVRMLEAYNHMYRSVYLHKKAVAFDIQIAYTLKIAWENNELHDIRKPETDTLLQMNDYVLMYRLLNCGSDQVKNYTNRYLRRDILKLVDEISVESDLHSIPIRDMSLSQIEERIKDEARLKDDALVILHTFKQKTPAPFPSDPEIWRNLQFYDHNKKQRVSFQSSEINYLTAILKAAYNIRLYTFKEHVNAVRDAWKKIRKG